MGDDEREKLKDNTQADMYTKSTYWIDEIRKLGTIPATFTTTTTAPGSVVHWPTPPPPTIEIVIDTKEKKKDIATKLSEAMRLLEEYNEVIIRLKK